jgi:hypothetical protein
MGQLPRNIIGRHASGDSQPLTAQQQDLLLKAERQRQWVQEELDSMVLAVRKRLGHFYTPEVPPPAVPDMVVDVIRKPPAQTQLQQRELLLHTQPPGTGTSAAIISNNNNVDLSDGAQVDSTTGTAVNEDATGEISGRKESVEGENNEEHEVINSNDVASSSSAAHEGQQLHVEQEQQVDADQLNWFAEKLQEIHEMVRIFPKDERNRELVVTGEKVYVGRDAPAYTWAFEQAGFVVKRRRPDMGHMTHKTFVDGTWRVLLCLALDTSHCFSTHSMPHTHR